MCNNSFRGCLRLWTLAIAAFTSQFAQAEQWQVTEILEEVTTIPPLTQVVSIKQGSSIPLTEPLEEVFLARAPFSIEFYNPLYDAEDDPNLYHGYQVAAFSSLRDFHQLEAGVSTEDTASFHGGSGFAAYPGGYDGVLYFKDRGSHYLYHGSDESRVRIVGKEGKYYKQAFDIDTFRYANKEEVAIEDSKRRALYLAIFNDANHNNFIDDGELHKVVVNFSD